MRERVTFIHDPDDAFHPNQLELQNNFLHIKALKAARQDHVTLGLYELPQEVSTIRCSGSYIIYRPLLMLVVLASAEAMS